MYLDIANLTSNIFNQINKNSKNEFNMSSKEEHWEDILVNKV